MNWRVFTAMAALVGAVAISSCDSGKSEEELCPGENRILDPSGGCCDDNDYSGFCDYKEPAVQEDVYEPREDIQTRVDTLVGDTPASPDIPSIEDTIEPYVPPANCLICDEFSDKEYTEQNWNIISGNMPPLITGAEYQVSDGTLTANHYSFDAKDTFDFNSDSIFEVRYRLKSPDSALTIRIYQPEADKSPLEILINKEGSGKVEMDYVLYTFDKPVIINAWHKLKIDLRENLFAPSVDDQPAAYEIPKLALGQVGLLFLTENEVELDYIAVVKPE